MRYIEWDVDVCPDNPERWALVGVGERGDHVREWLVLDSSDSRPGTKVTLHSGLGPAVVAIGDDLADLLTERHDDEWREGLRGWLSRWDGYTTTAVDGADIDDLRQIAAACERWRETLEQS